MQNLKKRKSDMKKNYNTPAVEKIEFNYEENVTASNFDPASPEHHGDVGHGIGMGGGCDHIPGHGNPKKPKP